MVNTKIHSATVHPVFTRLCGHFGKSANLFRCNISSLDFRRNIRDSIMDNELFLSP